MELISRERLIDEVVKLAKTNESDWRGVKFSASEIKFIIERQKPIESRPKGRQQWIRCSERLPEGIGTYMTTLDYGKHGLAVGQRYYHGTGLGWEDDCVIAWMFLPEPYKEETESEE